MAESESAEKKTSGGKLGTWFKAILGTAAGLLSGAFMMYLSPLLDRVVKPSKPIANFAVDMEGLTVTFQNRSSSRGEGWWDFGDGSPLEPVTAEQESVTHTYPKLGTYTVKLSVRNLLNEENERTVTINLEGHKVDPPSIVSLDAVPVSATTYAPATFRLVSRTKNAGLCVWDLDDGRPLEFVPDPAGEQDRLVTFTQPGGYVVKLAAVNGKLAQEKSVIVNVEEPPTGMVTAILNVSEQMTKVERAERPVTLTESFAQPQGDAQAFSRKVNAKPGYLIADAKLLEPIAATAARNVHLKVAPDRKTAILSGELLRGAGGLLNKGKPTPPVAFKMQLAEEKRIPMVKPATPVTSVLTAPGTALLSLAATPGDCTGLQRQFRLELRDGDRVLWQDSRLPQNVPLTVHNRRCTLTATPVGDQVRIDIVEARPGRGLSAN